jgi:hypothetical protein
VCLLQQNRELWAATSAAIGRCKLFLCTLLVMSFVAGAIKSQTPSKSSADGSLEAMVEATRELIRKGNIVAALQNLSLIESRSSNDPDAKFAVGEIFQELAALRAEQLQKLASESAAAHELLGKSYSIAFMGKAAMIAGATGLVGHHLWSCCSKTQPMQKLSRLAAMDSPFRIRSSNRSWSTSTSCRRFRPPGMWRMSFAAWARQLKRLVRAKLSERSTSITWSTSPDLVSRSALEDFMWFLRWERILNRALFTCE